MHLNLSSGQSPLRKTKSAEHLACPRIVISKVYWPQASLELNTQLFQPLRKKSQLVGLRWEEREAGLYLSLARGEEEGECSGH